MTFLGSNVGSTGFNINTSNLAFAQKVGNKILNKENDLDIFNVADMSIKRAAENAKLGNQQETNIFGSTGAFFNIGASAAQTFPKEKRENFVKNYIDANGDGKFDSEDIKLIDKDGNGFIDANEMKQYLSDTRDKSGINSSITDKGKQGNRFMGFIRGYSYFNQDGSVKMDAFK